MIVRKLLKGYDTIRKCNVYRSFTITLSDNDWRIHEYPRYHTSAFD